MIERFRGLNEDQPMSGLEIAWLSKVCGDTQQYRKGEGNINYAANVVKSLRWPGAVTVAKGGEYCSIYIGDGLKRGDPSYNPLQPEDLQTEPKD